MKVTNKLKQELVEFNRKYRKPNNERPLTIDEYINYLYGKGLPFNKKLLCKKAPLLTSPGIPCWANDPYKIPSASPNDHIPVKNSIMERLDQELPEVKQEILRKKNQIALPYSKGAYQYISDKELVTCLGRKL